jgi:pyrroline-5-carboxylate reductase
MSKRLAMSLAAGSKFCFLASSLRHLCRNMPGVPNDANEGALADSCSSLRYS